MVKNQLDLNSIVSKLPSLVLEPRIECVDHSATTIVLV